MSPSITPDPQVAEAVGRLHDFAHPRFESFETGDKEGLQWAAVASEPPRQEDVAALLNAPNREINEKETI